MIQTIFDTDYLHAAIFAVDEYFENMGKERPPVMLNAAVVTTAAAHCRSKGSKHSLSA